MSELYHHLKYKKYSYWEPWYLFKHLEKLGFVHKFDYSNNFRCIYCGKTLVEIDREIRENEQNYFKNY